MSYLVDSDWVVEFLKGRVQAQRLFQDLAAEGLAISLITYGEVLEGIFFGRDRAKEDEIFQQFLQGVLVVPLTEPSMHRFAELRGQLRRDGNLIGDMDLLIASTALAHDLTLVTRNRRHFERVPGLQLYGVS